jgi:hypothetical protein
MSRIKAFPFWRKQYLFHSKATSNVTLLNLYHPYKPIAKLNWWLWKYFALYQTLFTFKLNDDSKLYQIINKFTDANPDYIWAINRGTKSRYQKTTGLFISREPSKDFFFKWGNSKLAIESIKNEIAIDKELKNHSFAPKMLQFQINENEAFYTTAIIRGTKYKSLDINSNILALIHEIQSMQPQQAVNYYPHDKLITSFHHGDFSPWNLILEDDTQIIKAIDWEFCGIYPQGFDLLHYIFSVEFLIKKNSITQDIINEKYSIISDYYKTVGIDNWKPYLKEFAKICSKRYWNSKASDGFLKLLNYCN